MGLPLVFEVIIH